MGGTERKKPQTLYDSDGMTFWKRQSCGDSQKTSGRQMPEERAGRVGKAQRSFRVVEILCVTWQWRAPVLIHLCRPSCATPRADPHVAVDPGHRRITSNQCAALAGHVDSAGRSESVGAESGWETSVPAARFAVNLKLL